MEVDRLVYNADFELALVNNLTDETKARLSQQPVSQSRNASGREYTCKVPKLEGGTKIKLVQQQTMDRSHPGQKHWEAGDVKAREGENINNPYMAALD